MSLNKVVDEILRKGEEQKNQIVQLGERERDEQIAQMDREIAEDRQRAERSTDAMIDQMEQHELSSAELESKRLLLAAQRKVLAELKEQVLAELDNYPPETRKKLYSKLSSAAKKELKQGYVYSNSRDKALLQLPSGFTDAGTIECAGGLVFESKDRSVRLDYRFESILEEAWNKNLQEIFARLFR